MKFFWKVFLAVFVTLASVGTILIWASYRFVNHWTTQEYVSRYASLSKVLGDALGNLDTNTEALMRNAAEIVAKMDDEQGLLSKQTLSEMRDRLSVTHIFVVDKNGNFIRSTNENPSLIPNAFSFCEGYRGLLKNPGAFHATPIIHPNPEAKPYKFLFMSTKSGERLIEIGVRVDFVAQTLIKALGADPNLISVSLYSPVGEVLGRLSPDGVGFSDQRAAVPLNLPQMEENADVIRYFTKLPSSHPQCCQCEVAGITKNGEHYYVLESQISKKGLKTLQAGMQHAFAGLTILTLIIAFVMSRFVSRKLVANIEEAVKRLKLIQSGGLAKRIRLSGGDEVAYLTKEFDSVLDQLEDSQAKLIESEKLKAKVQLAREVAHNIKSPTIAIEMVMPMLNELPESVRKILRDSATDIRRLTDRLFHQANVDDKKSSALISEADSIALKPFLEDVVEKKNLEHKEGPTPYIVLRSTGLCADARIAVDPSEFGAVISNLINNACESYGDDTPRAIHISYSASDEICTISVKDFGRGIPQHVLDKIGREEVTFGKEGGQGIGLLHAFKTVRTWGGEIEIGSKIGVGTTVKIRIKNVAAADSNQRPRTIISDISNSVRGKDHNGPN